jgi:hypothetical protein
MCKPANVTMEEPDWPTHLNFHALRRFFVKFYYITQDI